MKIGELAEQVNIPASAIRYYERSGILPEPNRQNGQRLYDSKAIEELKAIKTAQHLGFQLTEIAILLETFRSEEDPSEQCRSLAERKLREIEEIIRNVNKMKRILEHGLSCNCTSLDGCYVQGKKN